MKLLTYTYLGTEHVGVLSRDEKYVTDIHEAGLPYTSMAELIGSCNKEQLDSLKRLTDEPVNPCALSEVRLLAPIPEPAQDIICLGINYKSHSDEANRFQNGELGREKNYPIYFSKRVNRAVDPDGLILSHRDIVDSLDYEAELGVIIGKDAVNVSEADASDYIFGYTIINDMSARNIQTRHKQWYFGKSLDGFTPIGPWIVTADDIQYPPELAIQSHVNGELRQNSNTGLLIFNIDYIISELSHGMTLKAGTIISTGTPAGVGMGFDPPQFLQSGDKVSCTIEGIGTITNTIE